MEWKAKLIRHKDENRIAVSFEKDASLIARIKKLEGSRWSQSLKVWHLPDTDEYREQFGLALVIDSLPSAEGIEGIAKFKSYLRSKRYSESTIKVYSDALKSFLFFYRLKAISAIDNDDVIRYNNDYILKNKLSPSYQNQIVNAIKLFFKIADNRKIVIDEIHRPKRSKTLPNVLSKEEVFKIIHNGGIISKGELYIKLIALIKVS